MFFSFNCSHVVRWATFYGEEAKAGGRVGPRLLLAKEDHYAEKAGVWGFHINTATYVLAFLGFDALRDHVCDIVITSLSIG